MNHFIDGMYLDLRSLPDNQIAVLMTINRQRAARMDEEYESLGAELFRRGHTPLPKG